MHPFYPSILLNKGLENTFLGEMEKIEIRRDFLKSDFYLLTGSFVFCLFFITSFPFVEWLIFTTLFLLFVITVGYLSFHVKTSYWITIPLSFVIAIIVVYLLNKFTSANIPFQIVIKMAIFYLIIGGFLQIYKNKKE